MCDRRRHRTSPLSVWSSLCSHRSSVKEKSWETSNKERLCKLMISLWKLTRFPRNLLVGVNFLLTVFTCHIIHFLNLKFYNRKVSARPRFFSLSFLLIPGCPRDNLKAQPMYYAVEYKPSCKRTEGKKKKLETKGARGARWSVGERGEEMDGPLHCCDRLKS